MNILFASDRIADLNELGIKPGTEGQHRALGLSELRGYDSSAGLHGKVHLAETHEVL